jgi:hypothetical protein
MDMQHLSIRRKIKSIVASVATLGLLASSGHAAPATAAPDNLLAGFQTPPQSAKPRVWWHWMNGNVTKDGIRRDLEWMHHVGIGGMNAIDASLSTPQVVKTRLVYMTPGWQDAFRYATSLADKLGLEMSIDSSPGWSETGGPWVTPQQAMKKLVWSETRISGGVPFHGVLPQPPANTGPIQNAPLMHGVLDQPSKDQLLQFYRDSIVVAYRVPVPLPHAATATASNGIADPAQFSDGDLTNGITLTPSTGSKQVWLQLDYSKPVEVQAITLAVTATDAPGADAVLEASDDGKNWRSVASIPATKLPQHTVTFAPVRARLFRLTVSPQAPVPLEGIFTNRAPGMAVGKILASLAGPTLPLSFQIHEVVLHAQATVNEAEAKAGFSIAPDYYAIATPSTLAQTAVKPGDVVLLTDRMKPDGTLDWTPPPGNWAVLRMGYAPLGTENHPAPPEATGLEVDKLNRDHVRDYMTSYLGMYGKVVGPKFMGKHGINVLTVDSTEIGAQNWTETILSDFRILRGYDPAPWLPALTGVVVGNAQDTDKFLWDFRRTIDELLARNHYGEVAAAAHEHGLINYAEALEDHRASFGDDMEMRRYADLPMAAMWTYGKQRESYPTYVADIKGAASVAHIYGQNLVAAESLTSALQPWSYAPRELKPVVDLEFALGINRVVVHTSVHQPVEKPPGLSLFVFGQFFNRLETWAEDAGPWVRYIARSSYLLQQGHYAADIAYFYGQEAPLTGLFGEKAIDVPQGYGFDFVNSDVLLNQMSAEQGGLVTKSGMRYRVLYLGGSSNYMTLPVLRRIRDLVSQGVVLVGKRPTGSPSLADDQKEFDAVADELFGSGTGDRVFADGSLTGAFSALSLPADFSYSMPESDTEILDLHRKLSSGDLYFLTNRLNRPETITATFRVTGMTPEIWNAVTGEVRPTDFKMHDGCTDVPLALGPYGSAFVVFRHPTTETSRNVPKPPPVPLASLAGPWQLSFQKNRGAPASITQNTLASWSENADPGVRYFSGSAVYAKTFRIPQKAKAGDRLLLDLGDVREIAEVSLNGQMLGTLWNPPFTLDITDAAHPGDNRLQIRVVNLWVNRLIGDAQPSEKTKYTFTTFPTYEPDAPLRPSGLLGPVQIEEVSP